MTSPTVSPQVPPPLNTAVILAAGMGVLCESHPIHLHMVEDLIWCEIDDDYLYERGITIYPGKLRDVNTFRIANISDLYLSDLYPEDMRIFSSKLETYVNESKIIVQPD